MKSLTVSGGVYAVVSGLLQVKGEASECASSHPAGLIYNQATCKGPRILSIEDSKKREISLAVIKGGNSVEKKHVPVLVKPIVEAANNIKNLVFLDATLGTGGHTKAVLEACPNARVIGIDRDSDALNYAKEILKPYGRQIEFHHMRFSQIKAFENRKINFILFDLGLSSLQLSEAERGFSFLSDGPLKMTMDKTQELSAHEVIKSKTAQELARLFIENGEPPNMARKIARLLKADVPKTTRELVNLVDTVYGGYRRRIHNSTRVFQALRREVNDEENELALGLKSAAEILLPGGLLAVISYHSLEDRYVKNFFDALVKGAPRHDRLSKSGCDEESDFSFYLSRKAIKPDPEEVSANKRARSARLRIIRKRNY